MIHVISLGAGVQSSTLALMAARGLVEPMPAMAIFADTQWEPRAVYDWLDHMETMLPFPVVRVTAGNLRAEQVDARVRSTRWVSLPYYTKGETGAVGKLRRQCTAEYKIEPIEKYLRREVLGLAPRKHAPKAVQIVQWRGISTDEASRMKPSRHKWMEVRYPLAMELGMSRHDCAAWLSENIGLPVPRSACIGCPFHSNAEWLRMKIEEPQEWQDAVDFDRKIRQAGGMRGETFLHRSCVPLDEVDFGSGDSRQKELWGGECEGMCGL